MELFDLLVLVFGKIPHLVQKPFEIELIGFLFQKRLILKERRVINLLQLLLDKAFHGRPEDQKDDHDTK